MQPSLPPPNGLLGIQAKQARKEINNDHPNEDVRPLFVED